MGLILDSSVVIAGERKGHTEKVAVEEIGISAITVVELAHGIERAKIEERRHRRQAFLDELVRDVPVYPVTVEIAKLAGRIEGAQAERGVTIACEDLLIAARALQLGLGVATTNVRHFEVIPNLRVVRF